MENQPVFAPMLGIGNGVTDVSFYTHAFGAVETRRFSNDDGSIHVSELAINGAVFRLHEEMPGSNTCSPGKHSCTTVVIGLMVTDPDAVVERAQLAGATVIEPVTDQPYGLRIGRIADPFGHYWEIYRPLE